MSTQHLLKCDEHPQPHQVGVLVVVGQYQTRTFNNISNVVFIILKDIVFFKHMKTTFQMFLNGLV